MQEKLHMSQHPGTDPPPFRSIISDINENRIFLKDSFCYPRGGGQQGDTGIISKINLETELLETLPGESIIHPVVSADGFNIGCLLYTSPSPRDATLSRMPSSA